MFKSVFAKYLIAIMSIFTVGFLILLVVLTSVVNQSMMDSKTKELSGMVNSLRDFADSTAAQNSPDGFEAEMNRLLTDPRSPLRFLLKSLTVNDPNLVLLISDSDGNLIYRIGKGNEEGTNSPGGKLPERLMESVAVGNTYQDMDSLGLSSEEMLVQAVGIFNSEGKLCGTVEACISGFSWQDMVKDLSQTLISSALLVLLAALIAVYFLTDRIISPIKEMSIAASKFAQGRFETRVLVRGRDEVAQLASSFNAMADSLENLEKMRTSFVANVSHDLRTPMTTISGFIDGIRDGVIPENERDHYLEIISMEVHRLSRLVASLLDLSRIQAGDRKFVMKPFDICEMGRVILISFEQQIDEKHLDVEFETQKDRMTVNADHDAIYQIFYNICHNAVKFAKPNGKLRIRITEIKDKKVEVAIFNEGNGIPKEDQPYVFERFYKADKSRGLDKSGVGLGLFIAKTIIESHGEKIRVESEPGENCEFFFTLASAHD